MNQYSLRHPSTVSKIDQAMRGAIAASTKTVNGMGYGWVANKQGNTMLHVRYKRNNNGTTELKFFDWRLNDVTITVRQALMSTDK